MNELRSLSKRSLIVGAAFATAAPALVRANSLLDLPGDPLTRRGLSAASRWASEEFFEYPACRMVFSDGSTYRWSIFPHPTRWEGSVNPEKKPIAYAVAIEVITTDDAGVRFINSVPVNGVRLAKNKRAQQQRGIDAAKKLSEVVNLGWL